MPTPKVIQNAVFLNIPYDKAFRPLYLAYIVGLIQLGLVPRVTLGMTGGRRRLERILELIQSCRYSIHDLSRVELDPHPPHTPRFNMPLELGLAIAWEQIASSRFKRPRHTWFVSETKQRRIQKSLSDLDGTDPNIHDGSVKGVMRELSNAFVRDGQPTVPEMLRTYRRVESKLDDILAKAGTKNVYEARVFKDLCFAAKVETIPQELKGS